MILRREQNEVRNWSREGVLVVDGADGAGKTTALAALAIDASQWGDVLIVCPTTAKESAIATLEKGYAAFSPDFGVTRAGKYLARLLASSSEDRATLCEAAAKFEAAAAKSPRTVRDIALPADADPNAIGLLREWAVAIAASEDGLEWVSHPGFAILDETNTSGADEARGALRELAEIIELALKLVPEETLVGNLFDLQSAVKDMAALPSNDDIALASEVVAKTIKLPYESLSILRDTLASGAGVPRSLWSLNGAQCHDFAAMVQSEQPDARATSEWIATEVLADEIVAEFHATFHGGVGMPDATVADIRRIAVLGRSLRGAEIEQAPSVDGNAEEAERRRKEIAALTRKVSSVFSDPPIEAMEIAEANEAYAALTKSGFDRFRASKEISAAMAYMKALGYKGSKNDADMHLALLMNLKQQMARLETALSAASDHSERRQRRLATLARLALHAGYGEDEARDWADRATEASIDAIRAAADLVDAAEAGRGAATPMRGFQRGAADVITSSSAMSRGQLAQRFREIGAFLVKMAELSEFERKLLIENPDITVAHLAAAARVANGGREISARVVEAAGLRRRALIGASALRERLSALRPPACLRLDAVFAAPFQAASRLVASAEDFRFRARLDALILRAKLPSWVRSMIPVLDKLPADTLGTAVDALEARVAFLHAAAPFVGVDGVGVAGADLPTENELDRELKVGSAKRQAVANGQGGWTAGGTGRISVVSETNVPADLSPYAFVAVDDARETGAGLLERIAGCGRPIALACEPGFDGEGSDDLVAAIRMVAPASAVTVVKLSAKVGALIAGFGAGSKEIRVEAAPDVRAALAAAMVGGAKWAVAA